MHVRGRWLIAGLALLGVVSGPAQADVPWTGPGWYVESTETGFDLFLVSGPYADKDQCESARPADTDDYSYDCEYESTDPDAAIPPRI
jgi:hypothetical protein